MKVLRVKDNKDGSATIDFEVTKSEKDIFKRAYNKKRFHPNLIRRALYEGIDIMTRKLAREKGGKK